MAALLQPQLSPGEERRGEEQSRGRTSGQCQESGMEGLWGAHGSSARPCPGPFWACPQLLSSTGAVPCLAAARHVFLLSRSQRGEGKGRGGWRLLVFSAELLHKFQRRHEDRNLLK